MLALIFSLFSIFSVARADTVLIQAPDASPTEYEAELMAHPELTTPIQQYLKSHPTRANKDRLLARFANAQEAFLSGDQEKATSLFESVMNLVNQDDWHETERSIFLNSSLRLAQLAHSPDDVEGWLKMSLLIGAGIKVDESLFPPPLLVRRKELMNALKKSAAVASLGTEGQIVLLNGRNCANDDCTLIPQVKKPIRVTVISNKWQPETFVKPLEDLVNVKTQQNLWSGQQPFAQSRIFHNINEKAPDIQVSQLKPNAETKPNDIVFPSEPHTNLTRNKWVWMGVGAAVITYFLIKQSQQHRDTETTTTYGY